MTKRYIYEEKYQLQLPKSYIYFNVYKCERVHDRKTQRLSSSTGDTPFLKFHSPIKTITYFIFQNLTKEERNVSLSVYKEILLDREYISATIKLINGNNIVEKRRR